MTRVSAAASATPVARTRQRVLDELRSRPEATTVTALASRLGIHPNTARFHLDRLIEFGQAEREPSAPQGPGRPAILVRATDQVHADSTRQFRLLAEALSLAVAATPGGAALAEAAGRTLGRRLVDEDAARADTEPMSALVETLRGLDFTPVRSGPEQIDLHSCPFLELVGTGGGVACAVHLGLMRGALDRLDASVEVISLTPFVSPGRCRTQLRAG